jgi:hypothetical protein
MPAFEIFSWPVLPFIFPVVSLLRFTVMGRTLKAVTCFAVVSAIAYYIQYSKMVCARYKGKGDMLPIIFSYFFIRSRLALKR